MGEVYYRNGCVQYMDAEDHVDISIPQQDVIALLASAEMPKISDQKEITDQIKNPGFGPSIKQLIKTKKAKSASVIISDATRGVPTYLVAPQIVKELVDGGIDPKNILFVVALGVHRPASDEEIRAAIGEELYGKVRVENHMPFDREAIVYLGNTQFGTPVEVYANAYNCDIHISIGKVELHCFAGYSGGRKSVLPGISSSRTIAINHTAEKISHKNSIPGTLEGNCIHEDMLQAAQLYGLDYTVNMVLNDDGEVSAVFAGALEPCHSAAVEYLNKYCKVPVSEKADIIVMNTGRPKNIDFYQAVNSLVAVMPIVQPNSVIVLFADCREGVNSPDMMLPFEMTSTIDELEKYMLTNYKIQMDCTLLILRLLKMGVKIIGISPNVSDEEFRKMHIEPCRNSADAIKKAYILTGKTNPRVLIYPHPQKSLPYFEIL